MEDTLQDNAGVDNLGELLGEENGSDPNIEDGDEDSSYDNSIPAEIPSLENMSSIPISPVFAEPSIHPIQRAQHRASVLSGVSLSKAFEIDEMRLGIKLVLLSQSSHFIVSQFS